MKRNSIFRDRRQGAALFTVLVVIFAISAFLATITASSLQRSFMARRLGDRIRALAIAEAGVNEAYTVLTTNWADRLADTAFPLTAYASGTYDVTVTPVSNNVAIICSTGVYGEVTAVAILDVANFGSGGGGGSGPTDVAYDYAILSGGTFRFNGCGDISGTNGAALLHSNDSMNIRGNASANLGIQSSTEIAIGNNITIDGDVTAPVLDYRPSKVTITGTASEQSVPLVDIPDIDLTPYYNWANDHGEVHNGFYRSGGTYNANGGVIWVNGNVQISSSTVINGSIVATGNIQITGSADVNASEYGFALASRDGDIKYTSSGVTKGLIYAKMGDYEQTANGRIEGQLIVKGSVKKGGNSDVLVFTKTVPVAPGGGEDTGDIIGVTAWQK